MKKCMVTVIVVIMIFVLTSCGNKEELNVRQMDGFLTSYEKAVELLEVTEFRLDNAELEDEIMRVNNHVFSFQFDEDTDEITEIRTTLETTLVGEEGKEAELENFVQASELLIRTLHPRIKDDELENMMAELKIPTCGDDVSSEVLIYDEICYAAVIHDGHRPVLRALLSGNVDVVESFEVTLGLSFGERVGSYTGDVIDGLPDGFGRFDTINDSGDKYYYEGYFSKGHFEGFGRSVWLDTGQLLEGDYHDDQLNGYGKMVLEGKVHYIGGYVSGKFDGWGTLYQSDGSIAYSGPFSNDLPADIDDFKSACIKIDYDELERDPNTYIRTPINFLGKVLQVIESETSAVQYRLAIDGGENVIFLYYDRKDGERRILEGDTVNAWGLSYGLIHYRSDTGIQVAIPSMNVYFIETV